MVNPYLGEIKLVGYNFAAQGFALCQGQLLGLAQNTALFSLLGTYYGGNGTTTFALPDLRGRVVQNQGTTALIGESDGTETVTLTLSEYPSHNHSVQVNGAPGVAGQPTNNYLGAVTPNVNTTGKIYAAPGTLQPLNPQAVGPYQGSGQPHDNLQPFLVMNYSIALNGVYPSRN
jgi:microcystin-dependent protein